MTYSFSDSVCFLSDVWVQVNFFPLTRTFTVICTIIENYVRKTLLLNKSAFSLKSVMNLFSRKRGGMQGIFLLFKNVFNPNLREL